MFRKGGHIWKCYAVITTHMKNVPTNQVAPVTAGAVVRKRLALCDQLNQQSIFWQHVQRIQTYENEYFVKWLAYAAAQGSTSSNMKIIMNLTLPIYPWPTSLNLPTRISIKDPNLASYFRKSRDLCYSIHNARMKILKEKQEYETWIHNSTLSVKGLKYPHYKGLNDWDVFNGY